MDVNKTKEDNVMIFLSWSGELSKNIAKIFSEDLPCIIIGVETFFSPDDIIKGKKWNAEISKKLNECKIGLLFVTKESINSQWMIFEAGALSNKMGESKVCPILFELEPKDILGPLTQFQTAIFSKDEMKRVFKMINLELEDKQLEESKFEKIFENWWPNLSKKLTNEISKNEKNCNIKNKSDREVLDEVLEYIKGSLEENRFNYNEIREMTASVKYWDDVLIRDFVEACDKIFFSVVQKDNYTLKHSMRKLIKILRYIIDKADVSLEIKKNYQVQISDYEDKVDKISFGDQEHEKDV